MKNLKESFGSRLKEIRKSRNFTQETLAEMIDLSPRQLIRIENGENFPSVEVLGKLSIILKTSLESLFNFQWNENSIHFSNEMRNSFSIKVIISEKFVTLKPNFPNLKNTEKPTIYTKSSDLDEVLFKLSQQQTRSLTVEFFKNSKRIAIKIYHPDRRIEDLMSQEDLINNELYNNIITKLNKISSETNKLTYIKTAIDSLKDKKARKNLNLLILGMDLTS